MHRLIRAVAALVLLAACAHQPPPKAAVTFRKQSAQIYSSAVLEPARLVGHWQQVATFAEGGQAGCAPGTVDIAATGQARWSLCLAGRAVSGSGPFVMARPGRFAVRGMADWWVMWADADYRTLVIGTPSGQFGFVLNRGATLPADRLKAATDIARFNGYAIDKFVVF